MLHRFIVSVAAAGVLLAPGLHAQSSPQASAAAAASGGADDTVDRYEWHFEDDPVYSAGTNPYGEWLGVRPQAKRAMLIRPRTSFVFELLASIGRL